MKSTENLWFSYEFKGVNSLIPLNSLNIRGESLFEAFQSCMKRNFEIKIFVILGMQDCVSNSSLAQQCV